MKNSELENSHLHFSKNNEEDMVSFMDILLMFARQVKVILIIPIIFCFLMIIYVSFFAKPVYISTAKIMSSSTSGNAISNAMGLASQFGIAMPVSESGPKWVYPEIIKSRTLARNILKRRFDTDSYGLQKPLLEILGFGNDINQKEIGTFEGLAIDNFLSMVNISENIKTGILTLNVTASEPNFAADVNQALIEELDTHQRDYNKTKTKEAKQFIEGRIIDTEKELINSEEALKVFMDRNRRIENSPALQLEKQRLSREVAVLTGVFTTLKQQLETTKIEEVKESDYVIVLDEPSRPLAPSKPKKGLMVIMAGILGISIGVVIGFLIEVFKKSKNEKKEKLNKVKSILVKNISDLFKIRKLT